MGSYYAGMKNATGSSYLRHYGIKDMHWGIRRFQNYDRTYTDAGKVRYEDWVTKRIYGGDVEKRSAVESMLEKRGEEYARTQAENRAASEKKTAERRASEAAKKEQEKSEAAAQQQEMQNAQSAIEQAAAQCKTPAAQKKMATIMNKLAAGKISIDEAVQLAQEALANDRAKVSTARRKQQAAQRKAQKESGWAKAGKREGTKYKGKEIQSSGKPSARVGNEWLDFFKKTSHQSKD